MKGRVTSFQLAPAGRNRSIATSYRRLEGNRPVGQGFFAAIARAPKMRSPRPARQTSASQNLNFPTPRKTEAARAAGIRSRAMNERLLRLSARKRDRPAPEIHDAGEMENPCPYCGALLWEGGSQELLFVASHAGSMSRRYKSRPIPSYRFSAGNRGGFGRVPRERPRI